MSPLLYLAGLILMTINVTVLPDWNALAYISYGCMVIGGIGTLAREIRINPDAFIEGEPLFLFRERHHKTRSQEKHG